MNRISRHLLFIILVAAINIRSSAQQTNVIIPPSPDAAALGMYGNMPVSTYTGVPSISIPVFNINYRDINIPIDLSYHSSGINVEQDASWVGLGWTLNAGGVITRTVRGGDDMQFATDGYSNLSMPYQGYPYDDQNEASGNFLEDVCNKNIDPEPDIFYFNFLGKSGSFILESGQNSSLNTVSGTPLKAEKLDIKYDKVNHKWQIKTADGYTYYFGTMELTETLHGVGNYGTGPESVTFDPLTDGFLSYDDIVVSAWYLDKIVSPLGEEVNYVYDSVTGMALSYLYGSAKMALSDIKQTMLLPFTTGCYMPSLKTSGTKIFTFHVYLKEINHSLGKIVFNKSLRDDMMPATSQVTGNYQYLLQGSSWMYYSQAGPQKLDNIEFLDKSGITLKKFELDYSYFNAQVTGDTKYNFKRLKLAKVRECSGPDCKPYYQLFYDESHPLPSKYSNAQDFWGYYNGANSNISRIPYGTYRFQLDNKLYSCGDSDRQPNSLFMTSGTLNKIIYPTGGSTEFEFEPHDYNHFNYDAFAITDFVNNSPVVITGLMTAQYDPAAFETVSFTITEPTQHVNIEGVMTYYASATTSDPCNVVDPGTIYVGNEPWYNLQNLSTSTSVTGGSMSQFLNFFISNYNNNCANLPYTPDAIDPIYRIKQNLVLNAGTYELKVYRRQGFTLNVTISKNVMPSRVITQNTNGVFAKMAGGLRIKKLTTRDNVTSVPLIKKYDYTVLGQDGQKYSMGRLLLYPNNHVPFYCQGDGYDNSILLSINGRSFNTSPLGTSGSGSIVGYDRVIELSGENGENGRTEYYYSNQIEEPLESQQFIEGFPTIKKTSNGLIMDVKHFDNAGNTVKTENYEYTKQLQKDIKGIATTHVLYMRRTYEGFAPITTCYDRNVVSQAYTVISDRWVPIKKIEKVYSQQSTNYIQTITDYEFDALTHLQLKSEQNTSSKGEIIKSVYSYPPDASWIPTAMWQDKFMYDKVVEKKVFRNTNLNNTYKAFYTAQANTFLLNKEEVATGAAALETLTTYNYAANGNVQEINNRNGARRSYLWGYNNSYPIAQAINANSNEIFFEGFEEPDTWNYLTALDNTKPHTGKYSARIDNPGPGEYFCHSTKWLTISLSTLTKYKYSGWVYSNGPGVEIFLFMKRTGETEYYSYVDAVSTNITGKWVYLEKEFTVPADVTQLNIRIDNNSPGTVWFDDIRLHPSAAQMTSYTYEPLIGMTSQCDVNNQLINYHYDPSGRLILILDQDKNILKKICYNYAGQPENCTLASFTNDQQQATFTSNVSCGAGTVPGTYTYTVPAGTYTSFIDKETANQLAKDAMNANGQAAANTLGCMAPFSGLNTTTAPWNVTVTNTAGTINNTYSFYPSSTATLLGNLPAGTYNITVVPMYSGSVTSPVQLILNGTTYTSMSFSLTNISITTATNFNLQPVPSSGACSFSMSSGYSTPTNSISSSGSTVGFYLVWYSSTTTIQPGSSYLVATINGGCRPSATRTISCSSSGRNWIITIYPNGQMYWQLQSGSPAASPNTTISVSNQSYAL